jgi:hypothetical protein
MSSSRQGPVELGAAAEDASKLTALVGELSWRAVEWNGASAPPWIKPAVARGESVEPGESGESGAARAQLRLQSPRYLRGRAASEASISS